MGLLEAIILGIVQGLTEFLPVSSSGHIEIAKVLLGSSQKQSLIMTIVLHAATALSTIFIFRKDIKEIINTEKKPKSNHLLANLEMQKNFFSFYLLEKTLSLRLQHS